MRSMSQDRSSSVRVPAPWLGDLGFQCASCGERTLNLAPKTLCKDAVFLGVGGVGGGGVTGSAVRTLSRAGGKPL